MLSKPSPPLLFPDMQLDSQALLALHVDPCLIVMPPCMGEADRFSLEALRHIHKQLDDDNDGGIEVNESVEVSSDTLFIVWQHSVDTSAYTMSLLNKISCSHLLSFGSQHIAATMINHHILATDVHAC